MKPKLFRRFASFLTVGGLSAIPFANQGFAATYTKADNTTVLNLASSWGGTAPGGADIANWSGTYNTAGSLAAPLPASSLAWQGITLGTLSGSAAGIVSIGGVGTPVALGSLATGSSGINLTGASHDLVINAETFNVAGSQTWTVPVGRNLRFGSSVGAANLDGAGGDTTVVTIAGGGVVDANQGASNGFSDYTGKWIVSPGATLRGMGTGIASWGSNTSADAITLNGGRLAVGAIGGSVGTISWPSPITLGTATTSTISGQHLGTGIPELTLQGQISGDGALVIDKAVGTPLIVRFDRADNLYTGNTNINSGASGSIAVYAHLGTTAGNKTPFGSGDVTITGSSATAAAVELNTDSSSTPSNQALSLNNKFQLNNATLRTREGLVTFNGDISLTGANVIQGQIDLKDITINGLMTGSGSVTLRATGSQKIILPSFNEHTGGTILGSGTSNAGVVLLGDENSLGTGPVTARGGQIWSNVTDLVLSNNFLVGGGTGGGLCFGGTNDIDLTGSVTVNDNSSRPFQNSGTGVITLAGISVSGGSSSMASFNSLSTTKGPFTVTGPITGAGKVEVRGGTVTLSGASTYTGTTTVSSSGNLLLNGSLTSAITMTGAGASISGSGSTTGNLTTTGASAGTIYLDPSAPGVAVTAASIAINGATKVELLGQQPIGTTNYTVLKYTGSFTGLANLSSSNSRGSFTDDALNKRINFASTAAIRTWNAAPSSVWNTSDLNWAEGDNRFFNGDAVVFGNTAAGPLTISGVVRPSLVTFNNTAGNDYLLTSSANNQIGGPSGFVKTGTGTATLVGPNINTGKSTISGGTLAIRSDVSLGAVPDSFVADQLTLAGGTLKFEPVPLAALTLNTNRGITLGAGSSALDTTAMGNALTATIAGDIAGSGDLTVFANGDTSLTGGGVPGSTVLSGQNSYSGDTTIKSGVVAIESYFGELESDVILDGGGLVDRNLNINFPQNILVAAGGGILRSYGNATTNFSGAIGNAPGVPSATLTHTDGGTQVFSGDGSAFQGTYVNARGSAYFDALDWSGTTVVNTDGTQLRFGIGTITSIKSLITDRNVFIENGTYLDLDSGSFTASPGEAADSFTVQGDGALTSSSGTLTFDFPTPFTSATQSVSIRIEDFNGSTPLTVVKNGIGGIANFNQSNNHTGGTVINAGRISATNQDAFGFGLVTVNSGGQAYLAAANGVFLNEMTIAGIGPSETAGNLGALRFDANTTVIGQLTVASSGARTVVYNGATGSILGPLSGTGNLELNSSSALHNGTLLLDSVASSYSGILTVAQGRLNLRSAQFGGSISVSDGATIGDEGAVNGTLTLGSSTGANLRLDATSPEALTANSLVLNATNGVSLDTLPPDANPILVVDYTSLTGSIANLTTAPTSLRRLAFTDTGTSITAQVATASRTWTGASSGVWDSAALNWAEGDQRFYSGDSVTFPDGAANRVINLPAAVSPASVTFNNNTGNDYSVSGRMIVATGGSFTKQGTGALTLTGTPSSVAVPVNLNGGLLVLGTTDYGRAFGLCPEIVINGGTLRVNGTNILYDGAGSHTVTVNAGGVAELNGFHNHFKTLNLNGGTVSGITPNTPGARFADEYGTFDTAVNVGGSQMSTITRAPGGTGLFALAGAPFVVNDSVAGTDLLVSAQFSGGALTKNGIGTMALTEANTYSGGTVINAGTILANNTSGSATGTGAVTVNNGGALAGTGALTSAVAVELGGTLAPGDGGIESINTGALNLKAGSTLAIQYNSSGTPLIDAVSTTGNLTLAGNLSLTDIAGSPTPIPAGTKLTLMFYTGTATGTFTGLPEGATFTNGVNTFKIRYADVKKVTLESLTVVSAGYPSWASTNAPGQNAGQDYDGDGVPNGLEYVLGGSSTTNDSGKLPTATTSGANFILTFVRDQDSKTADTSVAIEVGTTLATWPSVYTVGNDTASSSSGVTITSNGNGTETVALTIPRAPNSAKFGRVRVVVTP